MGKVIESTGTFGNRKLLIERYADFRKILGSEKNNIVSVGTETHDWTTYFRIILKE